MTESSLSSWSTPAYKPEVDPAKPGRSEQDVALWRELTARVMDAATENGWTKTGVANRIGMPDGTFGTWYAGNYNGRLDAQNAKVERWLNSLAEAAGIAAIVPASPRYLQLSVAAEITNSLSFAQAVAGFIVVTLDSGLGKTFAARHYAETRPHAHLVTMSPHTKTPHGMLVDIAEELEVRQHNLSKLVRAIGRRLLLSEGNSLLMIDEAQNLTDAAIDQARHFSDVYRTGVVLLGNTEVYGRFHEKGRNGPSYAQIRRRFDKRVQVERDRKGDVEAFITAWGVTDVETRRVLFGIGMKAGALGQIDKTVKLACILGGCQPPELTATLVSKAWSSRNLEV